MTQASIKNRLVYKVSKHIQKRIRYFYIKGKISSSSLILMAIYPGIHKMEIPADLSITSIEIWLIIKIEIQIIFQTKMIFKAKLTNKKSNKKHHKTKKARIKNLRQWISQTTAKKRIFKRIIKNNRKMINSMEWSL